MAALDIVIHFSANNAATGIENADSRVPVILTALVAFYLCNWMLYHITLELFWSMGEVPVPLQRFTEWLDYFFDPLDEHDGSEIFWPLPFSGWLRVVMTFVVWGLLDRFAELAPNLLEHDDLNEEVDVDFDVNFDVNSDEDLYVMLTHCFDRFENLDIY